VSDCFDATTRPASEDDMRIAKAWLVRALCLSKAECLEMSVQEVPAACLSCACEAAPEATAQCGADCWSLLVCVTVTCGGDLEDLDCISSECDAWASGAASAMAMIASPVIAACTDACTVEGDAGTDQDGGS
jgi:hypothetical protein